MSDIKLDDLVSLTKRRGFIFPGSSVYGGLSGTWDYGPLGVKLKNNLIDMWKNFFVDSREDMYMVDAAVIMNKKVWQASGHVDTFNDPLVECKKCHNRFRADKIDLSYCSVCGEKNSFTESKNFNLMFSTSIGPIGDGVGEVTIDRTELEKILSKDKKQTINLKTENENVVYLRPETAQGIFVNFKNVVDSFYPDIPFGIAQHGKAFRNEISPRDFIFRSREFEQLEIEYFINPENWQDKFDMWIQLIHQWFSMIGIKSDMVSEKEISESERAHYSRRTVDFEFDFPMGKEELMGLAYRTDFDLRNIEKFSKKSMEYKPKDGSAAFVPHVIEPSFGVERFILAILTSSYKTDEVNGEKRVFLDLPFNLSPVKAVIGPLVKNKTEVVDLSKKIFHEIKKEIPDIQWDDNNNIGKRYRRADEVGTPFCITIDFQTLEDGTVTIRERNTTVQTRIAYSKIVEYLKNFSRK